MKRLAVVILNYNGIHWLEKFLPTVVNFSAEADIYVIDNASTDASVEYLTTHFPAVKTIVLDRNLGFAGGYNEGLKLVPNEIFCLLNSDVEVTANWISPILNLFDGDRSIAAIQPKILSFNNRNAFEFAGAAGGFIDNLGYPYCRGRVFDRLEDDCGQYDDESQIFWASGCAFFIRAEDFWQEKGFDERFFAHQEEIDLCWRLQNRGRKIFYAGSSTVYHVGGGTLSTQSPQKTYLNFRNNLSMLLKNLPGNRVIPVIFTRLVLDGSAGLRFGLKNGLPHLWAIVRAHFAFYAEIPETLRRRGKVQMNHYYACKWLVFKHFLNK